MDNFSFVFSLFGLLMGLALAEVIGGFGSAIELRHKVRIGLLSPLLAVLIAFDLTSFWMVAWQVREAIPVNFLSLAGGLVIFGIYYLIAQLAFPDDLELWPDLDAYYFAHKRWLLGGMYVCNLLALAGQQAIGLDPFGNPRTVLALAAFTLGMAGAIFLPGKRTNIAFLLYQIALYPLFDILGIMGSGK
ncbi:MAG: hypothetical protein ABIW03_03425 [Sphingomicrobium sp.]